MGASLSKMFSGLIWGKKEIRILILGLVWPYADELGLPTLLINLSRTMLARQHSFTDSRSVKW